MQNCTQQEQWDSQCTYMMHNEIKMQGGRHLDVVQGSCPSILRLPAAIVGTRGYVLNLLGSASSDGGHKQFYAVHIKHGQAVPRTIHPQRDMERPYQVLTYI
jgi:hypothetical protein